MAKQTALAESLRQIEETEESLTRKESQHYVYSHLQRRSHYKFRIRDIEDSISRLNRESFQIDATRAELSLMMKRLQLKLILLTQERDRIRGYTGTTVSSSVLHGSEMKYDIESFKIDLDSACSACAVDISAAKYKVIEGEDRKSALQSELGQLEQRLQDRRAQFLFYTKTFEKSLKLQKKVSTGLLENSTNNTAILTKYFSKIKFYLNYLRRNQANIKKLIMNKLRRYYWLVFIKWNNRGGHSLGSDYTWVGKGGALLHRTKIKRLEIQSLLRGVVADTVSVLSELQVVSLPRISRRRLVAAVEYSCTEEGRDHSTLGRGDHLTGCGLLYEADGMVRAHKFTAAASLYEAQIISIRGRAVEDRRGRLRLLDSDMKLLALTHGRLGKLFLLMNKLDRF